jgi:hypothetical protein
MGAVALIPTVKILRGCCIGITTRFSMRYSRNSLQFRIATSHRVCGLFSLRKWSAVLSFSLGSFEACISGKSRPNPVTTRGPSAGSLKPDSSFFHSVFRQYLSYANLETFWHVYLRSVFVAAALVPRYGS